MKFTADQFAELCKGFDNPKTKATRVARILNGDYDPVKVPQVAHWVNQCFNKPRHDELVMAALNYTLEMHGVEAITIEDHWVDNYHGDIVATYLNTGDSYGLTIVRDSETGEFTVTTYADWLSAWEKRNEVELVDVETTYDPNDEGGE